MSMNLQCESKYIKMMGRLKATSLCLVPISISYLYHITYCALPINQSIHQVYFQVNMYKNEQKVQFTVIHVQGNHVHLEEQLTCKTNFTNCPEKGGS